MTYAKKKSMHYCFMYLYFFYFLFFWYTNIYIYIYCTKKKIYIYIHLNINIYIYTHLNWPYIHYKFTTPPLLPNKKITFSPKRGHQSTTFSPSRPMFFALSAAWNNSSQLSWGARKLNQTIVKFRVASPKDSYSYLMFGCFRGVEIPLRRPYPYCIS